MKKKRRKALKAAFPKTIPILMGFLFLGIAYGIYMNASGFSFVYPLVTSAVIYGGSLEFLCVSMLLSPFAPMQFLAMAIMVQARHLFYGIAMLDKFKDMGWKKFYLIFGMCDESFSINYMSEIPEDVDKGWFYFWVNFLNQCYWVGGATLGALLGDFIPFSTEGIEFVMTSMFVVILLDQWIKQKCHASVWIGMIASVICLLIFGADHFLIPTMLCILAGLSAIRKPFEFKLLEDERAGGVVE